MKKTTKSTKSVKSTKNTKNVKSTKNTKSSGKITKVKDGKKVKMGFMKFGNNEYKTLVAIGELKNGEVQVMLHGMSGDISDLIVLALERSESFRGVYEDAMNKEVINKFMKMTK